MDPPSIASVPCNPSAGGFGGSGGSIATVDANASEDATPDMDGDVGRGGGSAPGFEGRAGTAPDAEAARGAPIPLEPVGFAAGYDPEVEDGFAAGKAPDVDAALDPSAAGAALPGRGAPAPIGADGRGGGTGAEARGATAGSRGAFPFAPGAPFGAEAVALPLGAGPGFTVEVSFSEGGIPKLVATRAPLCGSSEIGPTLAGLFEAEKTSALGIGRTFVRCGKPPFRSAIFVLSIEGASSSPKRFA